MQATALITHEGPTFACEDKNIIGAVIRWF